VEPVPASLVKGAGATFSAPRPPSRSAARGCRCCYASADEAAAAASLAPFRRLAPVASDEVRVVDYAGVLDEGRMPPGMRMQMRNAFFRRLDGDRGVVP
jgi:hypothetical protein